jgi:hypothetical protein
MIPLVLAAVVAAAVAVPPSVAAPNGVVGVQETLSISVPKSRNTSLAVTFSTPGAATQTGSVLTDGNGNATLPWTPGLPGVWTITAAGTTSTLAVGAVPTSTTLAAPNTIVASTPVTYTATVTTLAGSIAPSGRVALVDATGAVAATATLVPGTTSRAANAALTWTPGTTTRALRAVYTPASSAFAPSASGYQAPNVGGAPIVTLQFPDTMYVGVPALLQGITGAGVPGGSLSFNQQIDGFMFWIGGSHPVINSVASQAWAPTQSGYLTIGVQFASSDFTVNANSSQPVFIQPAPAPDGVSLTVNGGPWPPTLPTMGTAQLSATATSGNPVTLSATGSCVIAGATLRALAAGPCTVTAASMGNGGSLAPSTTSFVTTASAPQAPAKRPISR